MTTASVQFSLNRLLGFISDINNIMCKNRKNLNNIVINYFVFYLNRMNKNIYPKFYYLSCLICDGWWGNTISKLIDFKRKLEIYWIYIPI